MNKLTKEQAAIIGAYTGTLAGDFASLHEYIEQKLGRPVFTHEMVTEEFQAELKSKSRQDFLNLCAL